MKILLANPPASSLYHRVGLRLIPLGLAYVAAALRQGGHDVRVIDFEVEKGDHRKLPYAEYDVVGVGSDTTRWPAAVKIAEAAKAAGATVVAGGPHVSFLDDEALATGAVDYVVRSEGEYATLDLVNCLEAKGDPAALAGVSFVRGGKVVRTPARAFIEDLDALPHPARDLFPRRRYRATLERRELASVVTSRGCPSNCDFCSCSTFSGQKLRCRSVESVMDELERLYVHDGYRAVCFFDDNLTLNAARTERICEEIIKRKWDLKWWAFSRTDTALKRPDLIKLMARAGLRKVFVGFESANQESLDSSNKKASVETSFKAMEVFHKNSVKVWGAFMLGFDGETEEMVNNTVRFAVRLNPDIAQFSLVTPYPGTRLFKRVEGRLLSRDWRRFWGGMPTIDLPNMRPERLQKLFWKAYTSFYLRPGVILRWVPYFTFVSLRYYLEPGNTLKRFMALGRRGKALSSQLVPKMQRDAF